jgi:quercetin dioxygenase-like cupin family protein
MHVTRLAEAKTYEAPGHIGMRMLRLQGREAGPSDVMWLGMSQLEPGGRIEPSSAPQERFYVVLAGEVEISNGVETHVLSQWDSCRIGPNETRIVRNASGAPAVTLLAMALPPKT